MTERSDLPHTSSFTTPDGDLAYRDQGTGPALVLLHGGFLDHTQWEPQIRAFAPHWRVIAPDVRGHGGSANATRPFRATDDLAALLRHLGVGPAVVAGVSMGGGIAVDTALEHPGLVRAVVVSGVGTSEPVFEDAWSLEVLAAQQRALVAGDVAGWLDAFQRFTAGPHRRLTDVDADVLGRVRGAALRTVSKHTADEPDHRVPVGDTWKRATEIDVPVLAINGALDSPDHLAMAERLVHGVRDGRVATVPDSAHYPNLENPDAFDGHLAEFLRNLPPLGPS
ncbi:alpha/beta fold hydrolase [Streptomyces sp. NPDC088387]|uniref:alpha/beta fold hydrolase n=1 Tax=Streptomyces sp. NPDC088387 TaxID=3365859 RepID=UPI0038191F20